MSSRPCCNRCFAKEQVEETWRGDPPPYENYRIFLTHYPVADADIELVAVNGSLITDYELENASGKLSLGAWADPIIVTYSGGYALPDEAPPALKQAMMLLVQAGRSQIVRGMNMSGIRSISHKEFARHVFRSQCQRQQGRRRRAAGRGRRDRSTRCSTTTCAFRSDAFARRSAKSPRSSMP